MRENWKARAPHHHVWCSTVEIPVNHSKNLAQPSPQMKTLTYAAIISLIVPTISAGEKKYEKLLNYEGVTIREVRRDEVKIMHSGGFATIPIESLPENIRQDLGMSLDGIDEHREKIANEKAEQDRVTRSQAHAQKILADSHLRIESANVLQVVEGGVLVQVYATWDGTYRQEPQYQKRTYKTGTALSGYRTETRKEFTGNKKLKNIRHCRNWTIFIQCDNLKFIDNSKFSGNVWANGTFSYATALGVTKTIPKYTSNPNDIIKNPPGSPRAGLDERQPPPGG